MSIKRKILITGKLTNSDHSRDQFQRLAQTFDKSVTVYYPTAFAEPTATWDESIGSDISRLMGCHELHLLHTWQGHKRSEILRNVALSISSIKIYYH